MEDKYKKIIEQSESSLTSLAERLNEICGRTSVLDSSSVFGTLNGNSLVSDLIHSKERSVTDMIINGGVLSSALESPSKWTMGSLAGSSLDSYDVTRGLLNPNYTTLAAMEAKTSVLAHNEGFAHVTSVASQLTTISDILSSQTAGVREMIAPSSMLSDLQSIAEYTHKNIIDTGRVSAWQLGVLDSASYLVDRHVDWSSRFISTTIKESVNFHFAGIDDYLPKVNVIELLPCELENEKIKNQNITPGDALEKIPSFILSEKGKKLVEKIVNINKTCQRLGCEQIFKYTNTTMMSAATLSGTICNNSDNFSNVIDGLYFVFYENLSHIKDVVSDETVRSEDVYQCIFRVKTLRTDYRHDCEHGKNIKNKIKNIGDVYSYYIGKVTPSSSDDYIKAQEKLYDEFNKLADHLQSIIEKQICS